MSDAIKCGKCGFVYWTSCYENWGTCTHCSTNNDFSEEDATLVSSSSIHKFLPDNGE